LAESTHEEIDAELLSIFLEEAHEVLQTMGDQRPCWWPIRTIPRPSPPFAAIPIR
jgi:hypothetical protein